MSLLAKQKASGKEKSNKSLELKILNSQPKSGLLIKASWVSKSVHLTNRRLTRPRMPDNTATASEPGKVNNTLLHATVLSHPRCSGDGGRGPCPVAVAPGIRLFYLWTPALRALGSDGRDSSLTRNTRSEDTETGLFSAPPSLPPSLMAKTGSIQKKRLPGINLFPPP